MNLRQLPNVITGLRMLLVAPLVWCLHVGDFRTALWLALAAGLSDALDGWLAKRFDWRTPLGSLLDPVADKLLLVGSFVGLWLVGALPGWLVALAIARDVLIVGGAVAYHNLIGHLQGEPTLLGKLTTVIQIVLVVVVLFGLAIQHVPGIDILLLVVATGLLTAASGIDYVVRWGARARKQWRAGHASDPNGRRP